MHSFSMRLLTVPLHRLELDLCWPGPTLSVDMESSSTNAADVNNNNAVMTWALETVAAAIIRHPRNNITVRMVSFSRFVFVYFVIIVGIIWTRKHHLSLRRIRFSDSFPNGIYSRRCGRTRPAANGSKEREDEWPVPG
jgi:hypothetical protein